MASLHSDALIANPDELVRALRLAKDVAATKDSLVTLGVRPTTPDQPPSATSRWEMCSLASGK